MPSLLLSNATIRRLAGRPRRDELNQRNTFAARGTWGGRRSGDPLCWKHIEPRYQVSKRIRSFRTRKISLPCRQRIVRVCALKMCNHASPDRCFTGVSRAVLRTARQDAITEEVPLHCAGKGGRGLQITFYSKHSSSRMPLPDSNGHRKHSILA